MQNAMIIDSRDNVIGIAPPDIKAGEHVHIHNVEGHRENLEAKVK